MTAAHHPHPMAPAQALPAQFQDIGMNTAEASVDTQGPGWVWLLIPGLWLLVAIAGFFALSHWPEVFA